MLALNAFKTIVLNYIIRMVKRAIGGALTSPLMKAHLKNFHFILILQTMKSS